MDGTEAPRHRAHAPPVGGYLALTAAALVALAVLARLGHAPLAQVGGGLVDAAIALAGLGALALAVARLRGRVTELVHARDTLQRLTESAPGSVFSLDTSGRYTRLARSTALTGYDADQLAGAHYSEVIVPEERARVAEEFASVLNGESRVLETTILRKDRERVHASVTAIPIVTGGQVTGVHGIARDISGRKRLEHALRASEGRYRSLFENSIDGIVLASRAGRIEAVNPAACRLLARPEEQLLARPLRAFAEPENAAEAAWMAREQRRRGRVRGEVWLRRGDGARVRVEVSSAGYRDESGHERACLILRDVTERETALEQLRLAGNALSSTAEGVAIVDRRWRIVSANAGFTRIAGVAPEEALGRRPRLEFDTRGIAAVRERRRIVRDHGYWQGEAVKRLPDGRGLPVRVSVSPVHDETGRLTNFVVLYSDISEHKRQQRRLNRLAHYDPLTGLPNRALLEERARTAIVRARRDGRGAAVLFIDLDRFKQVNDSLGHAAGDHLLQHVGQRLTRTLRTTDTVARLGGDEFAVLLEDLDDPRDAGVPARQILEALREPFTVDGQPVHIGAGIGIACHPRDGAEFSSLLQHADAAMYHAKATGRGAYRFHSPELNTRARRLLRVQQELSRALSRGELSLHYQPLLDLRSGAPTGVEALIRWHHPVLGEIPPDEFVPLAEETGLMVPLGEWILRRACADLRALHDAGHAGLRVAVNLSARQLRRSDIVRQINAVLRETGLAPRSLEVDVAERASMDPASRLPRTARALHERGVALALDDFGAGGSSCEQLVELAAQRFKLDGSFVQGLPDQPRCRAVTRTVIALAHSLGARVIAEGVETAAQRDALVRLGCEEGQGRALGPPASLDTLRDVLGRGAGSPSA